MISLKNKIDIITGGSRGIGAATAKLFAKAGADVVINYVSHEKEARQTAEAVRQLGCRAVLQQGNLALRASAEDLVRTAVRAYDRIDILVNNAGIWTFGSIGDLSQNIWDETIDVNLKSAVNVTNAAVPYLRKTGGRIINVTSTAAQRGEAHHSHYAASKAGLTALTKSWAVELAPDIRVNTVAPGWVDTEMNKDVFADDNFRHKVSETIPLGKIATPEEIAGPILFLASDLANHLTGSTISVNGGSVLV